MKVFRVNDCEWYMAETLEQAVDLCAKDCELPADEAAHDPCEVSDADMQRLIFTDDMANPRGSDRRTFAEELARRVAAGAGPGAFATTEF
jgi:hypothetical protein